ncbi:hypothetical protein PR048_013173 [Dryococelus australis]|uniref:Uncharacterized protein n=1 Tax=Dryococelus australis TaxID=614101 RepID=A0ABQ9HS82_9NEOP|nr:hypothetical protein PR048_013173 [Dryococelus australis]
METCSDINNETWIIYALAAACGTGLQHAKTSEIYGHLGTKDPIITCVTVNISDCVCMAGNHFKRRRTN